MADPGTPNPAANSPEGAEGAPVTPPPAEPGAAPAAVDATHTSVDAPHPEIEHKTPPKKGPRPLRLLGKVLVRLYTAGLALFILAVCLSAIVYLFRSVFQPAHIPDKLKGWQGQVDAASLREPHVPGITGMAGRAPIGHFHRVDHWFQVDARNGCTVAGCHSPLPHMPKSKIAAFANLHVTFMDCMVCHDPSAKQSGRIEARWIAIANYTTQAPPAVLRLAALLEPLKIGDKAEAQRIHGTMVALLKDVIQTAGTDPALEDLLVQIESAVPDSPLWKRSVQRLIAELPRHTRGEYAAKIARGGNVKDTASLASQTAAFLAAPEGSAQRKQISDSIHKEILAQPSACAICHTTEPTGMLDLPALGYSPARARVLRELPLARMAQQIRQGESFQLPKLLESQP